MDLFDPSQLTPFQLRAAMVAAELAGQIERDRDRHPGTTVNGLMEIRITRNGRSWDKAFRRSYGSTMYTDETNYN